MKRFIVIALFLPLFYTTLGYYAQFLVLQWRVKEAVHEAWIAALPDAAFVRIDEAAVDAHGHWEDRGKEFSFHDHMYDVVRTRVMGATTWLFCLDDENEERLDRQAEAVTQANQEHPDKKAGHSLVITIGDIFCESFSWEMPSPGCIMRQYCDLVASPLAGRDPEIAGPPPKV